MQNAPEWMTESKARLVFAFPFGTMGPAMRHWRNSELGSIPSGVVIQV